MAKIINPFIVTGKIAPEYFCDRVSESARLVKSITNGNNLVVISPRRMGKTGLIQFCYDKPGIGKEYYTFFIDILHTSSLREFTYLLGREIYETLLPRSRKMATLFIQTIKSISGKFGFDPISNLPTFNVELGDIERPEYTLDEIFQYLSHADKPCIVAIDEFQQITDYPEKGVEGLLRSYIQFLPHVHFIFSGSKQHLMDEIFTSTKRPFYRSTEKMTLQPIPVEDYFLFANEWMNQGGRQLGRNLFQQIYQRFGGHTWYMQYILNRLYEQPQPTIDEKLIEECISDIIHSEIDSYQQLYGMLTENQSSLLRAIAREKIVTAINSSAFIKKYGLKGSSSINTALKTLINKEYVFKSDRGYCVYDRFMELWLQTLPYPIK